ncbi:MAG: hypothetical protein K0S86_2504, partial [Geminicoccaceae bacterium]|nr:hypothetical protein [Geminicoccaceae bacterium]
MRTAARDATVPERGTDSPFPAPSPAERSGRFRLIRAIAVPTG